ncbi:tetratricopeptide repeat protein [Psychrosphaera sp. F3M07]|uniref:tetratricopeptide repeat protein n=1 Tax=Psychrosphaera sp. F3M07 TaxID=2841560 RepID=UPI001C091754|nr:tetratricopeptide repeat protein [Psychrosphaera sp. F3M07]MBU2917851.1 tetratricopeptide repeat protein [Psychrosphaera sp. F3M07]
MENSKAKKLSKKVWLFRGIMILIPFLFFAILEIGLRLAGYGQQIPLFMQNPSAPEYLLPTPDVVKRYFAKGAESPNVTIETNFFKKIKPEDGIRIIVQGGSTAAGFPYGFGASIAGMLDYRLKQTFPERPVEVINTALSAVNSYTLLDFADEIIEQQPDAVLIYAGHNEYLGILGVGSAYTAANSHGATLLYLKLKNSRIFQLMQSIYSSFSSINTMSNSKQNDNVRTVMAKVAKHKNIPHDSALFKQGLNQFEQNMSLLLGKYNKAGIPVFISTIASNLADQKPFSSALLSEEEEQLVATVQTDPSSFELKQREQLEQLSISNKSADGYYALGQVWLKTQEYDKAKYAFVQARQHDLLRFRAPIEINQIIETLAQENKVYLVDAEADLSKVAEQHIIGKSLMIEHLHPTIKGYFEISNSFYQALKSTKVFGEFPHPISKFNAQQELPVFDAEVVWGNAKIAGLMADYPFTKQPQQPDYPELKSWSDKLGFAAYKKQVSWLDIANQSLQYANKIQDQLTIIKAVKLLSDAMPDNESYAYQAGVTLISQKRPKEAIRYLTRAMDIQPNNTNSRLALAHAYTQQSDYSTALIWLDSVLKIEPNNTVALSVSKQIKALSVQ